MADFFIADRPHFMYKAFCAYVCVRVDLYSELVRSLGDSSILGGAAQHHHHHHLARFVAPGLLGIVLAAAAVVAV